MQMTKTEQRRQLVRHWEAARGDHGALARVMARTSDRFSRGLAEFTDRERKGLSYENRGNTERTIKARVELENHRRI